MSDNGPPFNSNEFAEFAQKWNFRHITSSPNYAQSNGQIECTIQTLKQMLSQCATVKQDWKQALLQLRATPTASNITSPSGDSTLQNCQNSEWTTANTYIGQISKPSLREDKRSRPVTTANDTKHVTSAHFIYNRMSLYNTEMDDGNRPKLLRLDQNQEATPVQLLQAKHFTTIDARYSLLDYLINNNPSHMMSSSQPLSSQL